MSAQSTAQHSTSTRRRDKALSVLPYSLTSPRYVRCQHMARNFSSAHRTDRSPPPLFEGNGSPPRFRRYVTAMVFRGATVARRRGERGAGSKEIVIGSPTR